MAMASGMITMGWPRRFNQSGPQRSASWLASSQSKYSGSSISNSAPSAAMASTPPTATRPNITAMVLLAATGTAAQTVCSRPGRAGTKRRTTGGTSGQSRAATPSVMPIAARVATPVADAANATTDPDDSLR